MSTDEQTRPAIEAGGLSFAFGSRQALSEVSCRVMPGERLAVAGPNGAGKTTLLSLLAGRLEPGSGTITRSGAVSFVPQAPALYSRLTVTENLRLFASLAGLSDPDNAVAEMLSQAGLEQWGGDLAGRLSGGGRQRVNIAIGLFGNPSVLLLDEPSSGLDPRQRRRLWSFVDQRADRGTAVIFSSHDLAEAERHAGRLLVLAEGERIHYGSATELRAAVPGGAALDIEEALLAFLDRSGHGDD